ncbi:MAG: hypothetical protein IPK17_04325 [Chloroflexi bacterium]|uniref:hypothetical protein n=1 Tax=Candidatus Flexifilum breve TaxID=3140694 RepID=UPI003135A783|nr:hypothetical protein [Chloroflexota bacterium]
MQETLAYALELMNETLAAAIVVIAASLALYNLTRSFDNRVARTSGIVLGFMTIAYLVDTFTALGPTPGTYQAMLRVQWIGIAYMPVALYHLSDALLATTGLPSRGRRKRVIRILYAISTVFLIAAAFTDTLLTPVRLIPEFSTFGLVYGVKAGPVLPAYLVHFFGATVAAFINVQRARKRCLARSTRRRMGYLQVAMLTPAFGIFPFSLLLGQGSEFTLTGLFLVNLTNVIVVFMLLFLAYPLSFFGSRIPDRVVKVDLMRFILRGPATALLALVVITFTAPATRILGLPGQDFMPFAVVAVVLGWQWGIALALPFLERRLVYGGEDADQLEKLQNLSERLLTRSDLLQLLEATLSSTCDYLRVNSAFVAGLSDSAPEVIAAVGSIRPSAALLAEETATIDQLLRNGVDELHIATWHTYWLMPLYSLRSDTSELVGFMGIQARAVEVDLDEDDAAMLKTFTRRASGALDDMRLQTDVYAALEGLLPQIVLTRTAAAELEYAQGRDGTAPKAIDVDTEQFREQVRAALRHYWGGPGLSSSTLLDMQIVKDALPANDNNAVRALRSVLQQAIERQKPDGAPKSTAPEWMIYNIVQMRFVDKMKVREAAYKLSMSEPDFYRKQLIAVYAVADTLLAMETERLNGTAD